jgi:hypothetical protein
VQYWIWNGGTGEANVQSLHWIIGEIHETKYTQHIDQIVRKRQTRPADPKKKFSYDPWIAHSLKPVKDGLQWTAGRQSGKI